jgi:nucleoside-diphosphate-sugar epimerase
LCQPWSYSTPCGRQGELGGCIVLLITGATGFIGSHLTARLAAEAPRTRLLVRDASRLSASSAALPSVVEVVPGDLSDPDAVATAVRGCEVVIHLGAATGGDWSTFEAATVQGTRHVLEAARQHGARVVHVSSMSVYDFAALPDGAIVDETAPLDREPTRRNDYARAKWLADEVAREYAAGGDAPVVVLRPGTVYGPGGRAPMIVTARELPGNVRLLFGGGKRELPLLYVENLVDVLLVLASGVGGDGRIYNVVDDQRPTERGYLEALDGLRGRTMRTVSLPASALQLVARGLQLRRRLAGRAGGMDMVHAVSRVTRRVRFDAAALRRDIGWRSRVGLEEGLRRTFALGTAVGYSVSVQ